MSRQQPFLYKVQLILRSNIDYIWIQTIHNSYFYLLLNPTTFPVKDYKPKVSHCSLEG